jgi:hypothetical protein
MKVLVIKPFLYGADGINAVTLGRGDELEIHDELVRGLIKEGFVESPASSGSPTMRRRRTAEQRSLWTVATECFCLVREGEMPQNYSITTVLTARHRQTSPILRQSRMS